MGATACGVLFLLVAMNVATSIWLARVDFLSPMQKWIQGSMIWLIPGIGAAPVSGVLLSYRELREPKSHHIPNDNDDPGINL